MTLTATCNSGKFYSPEPARVMKFGKRNQDVKILGINQMGNNFLFPLMAELALQTSNSQISLAHGKCMPVFLALFMT